MAWAKDMLLRVERLDLGFEEKGVVERAILWSLGVDDVLEGRDCDWYVEEAEKAKRLAEKLKGREPKLAEILRQYVEECRYAERLCREGPPDEWDEY